MNPETENTAAVPEVLTDGAPDGVAAPEDAGGGDDDKSAVSDPGELIRIGTMLQALRDEVRELDLDDEGRAHLREVHKRAINAILANISGDLREELTELALPISDNPTTSELRIAQAQLVGWLDGLFRGIQAAMISRQMAGPQMPPQLPEGRDRPGGPYL